jgi:hypothetical protein
MLAMSWSQRERYLVIIKYPDMHFHMHFSNATKNEWLIICLHWLRLTFDYVTIARTKFGSASAAPCIAPL